MVELLISSGILRGRGTGCRLGGKGRCDLWLGVGLRPCFELGLGRDCYPVMGTLVPLLRALFVSVCVCASVMSV